MDLRAACFEKRGGVPADEPPHLTVGGERAPLPRMWPSPRPKPLWGVCLYHLSARAAMPLHWARQAWALAGSRLGGASLCRFIPLTPPLGAGGWAGSWRALQAPGEGLSP